MTLLLDQAGREICPACRIQLEKPGLYLVDDQNIRQFRCLLHVLLLLQLALEPIKAVSINREE